MKLKELFNIKNGITSTSVNVSPTQFKGSIPFLRPAKSQQRTISGWVSEDEVESADIYPEGSLFVSTNGEGSHSYSYVSSFRFACNSDVSVLLPKVKMGLEEKIFYAHCIQKNRYKFSYGRKPKGEKLKLIDIPDYVPKWVKESSVDKSKKCLTTAIRQEKNGLKYLDQKDWEFFAIKTLFTITPTKGTTTDELIKGSEIPYIAAKKEDNGLTFMCAKKGNENFISKGNCIVFIQLGQGSAGYALYQGSDFIGMSGKTTCGHNPSLNAYSGLFIVAVLDLERPKFSFGRSWTGNRLLNTKIKLPAIKRVVISEAGKEEVICEPNWEYMEAYIKSLPYSDLINPTQDK